MEFYKITIMERIDHRPQKDIVYFTSEIGLFSSIEKAKEYIYEEINKKSKKITKKIDVVENSNTSISCLYGKTDITYLISKAEIIS
jgi:galactose-1-phosphate uridylyltransferase